MTINIYFMKRENLTNNYLRIVSWNSRGLSAAIPYLRNLLEGTDFLSLSEHWLHNNTLYKLNDASDKFFCHGRASRSASESNFGIRRGSGGVAIYWRKNIPGVSPLLSINHDRICGVRMQTPDNTIINILSVYMPAAGSCEDLTTILDELSCIVESFENGAVNIITGDLNGDLGIDGGPRGMKPATRAGREVLKFTKKYDYIAANLMSIAIGSVNTFACHNGASTLDYVMLPRAYSDNVMSCYTNPEHPLNTSDHFPVEVTLMIHNLPRCIDAPQMQTTLRWDKVDHADMANIYEHPLTAILEGIQTDGYEGTIPHNEIDILFERVVKDIHSATSQVPRSKFVSHLKPFWTDELSVLKRDKMHWFDLWKRQGRTLDDNDPVRVRMKASKKLFHKTIRRLSREYDNATIAEAANLAEIDRDRFWRVFRRMKGISNTRVQAIKNQQSRVVYDIESILDVWRLHFSRLSSPRDSPTYDQDHYNYVTRQVKEWQEGRDHSIFLEEPFTFNEIRDSIKKLHLKKAPGHDGITAEHLRYGGYALCVKVCYLFNACVRAEYVPSNFRQGIQVPLYKGKNTCPLEPDNYRGITLLSSFNKLFEMVLWRRIETWWENVRVISELQGACRKGSSCVHTALTLQETIASQCEGGKKVFVAFFDVSKAFDSVWIDGLFFQLHELGIRDSLWRILYKGYQNFVCRVRIGDRTSLPYPMLCGIHQGGFLSLVKYIAFVNSLLIELKNSNLCCSIERVQTTPLGYADDLATCTLSGNKMHRVMNIVEKHGRTWRYSFNAKKSAVMVLGETLRETTIGRQNRMFKLGDNRVKETPHYDHVGVKICLKGDFFVRTEEKVKKARTVLNMATCMGVRKGGLNLSTCCTIFWTVVIPTLCFGCELWILKRQDIQILQGFQRYAARRLQRLHPRSLNSTSRICLGWLDIIRYIMVKKALFLRTIFIMKEYIPIKLVLMQKAMDMQEEVSPNIHNSPITDMLNTCVTLNLIPNIRQMANGVIMSKMQWKKSVWEKAWALEMDEFNLYDDHKTVLLKRVLSGPAYSIWWQMSDSNHYIMRQCEIMVKLLCKASALKDDDPRLKRQPFGARMCIRCNLGAPEDANHVIMQCPANSDNRGFLNAEINEITPDIDPGNFLGVVLGKFLDGWSYEQMVPIWEISARYVTTMYFDTLRARQGVG